MDALQQIGRVVAVRSAQGHRIESGHVVAYCPAPTFVLEREDGTQFSWRVDLCDSCGAIDEIDYWRARAIAAEQRLDRIKGENS